MKKLGNLKLSDAKVMDVHEMKTITGGQYGGSNTCSNTGTSTGLQGGTADVVCGGSCPPVVQTGAFGEPGPTKTLKCEKYRVLSTIACICQ